MAANTVFISFPIVDPTEWPSLSSSLQFILLVTDGNIVTRSSSQRLTFQIKSPPPSSLVSVCVLWLSKVKSDSLSIATDSMVTVFTWCGGVFTASSWEVNSHPPTHTRTHTHTHTHTHANTFSFSRNISVKCQVTHVHIYPTRSDPTVENHSLHHIFIFMSMFTTRS